MIKKITFLLFLFASVQGIAQDDQKEKKWYIPHHAKVQFAGNIGFLSAGPGYLHGKNKLETDLMLGYLPKAIGGDRIVSLTGKMTYSPWKTAINDNWNIVPFSIGPYLSYSFGSQFDTWLPNEYPDGYYWWATSLRVGAFFGGRIEMPLDPQRNVKSLGFYYELGTYDLEFISFVQNTDYLSVTDIFTLALGVKLQLY